MEKKQNAEKEESPYTITSVVFIAVIIISLLFKVYYKQKPVHSTKVMMYKVAMYHKNKKIDTIEINQVPILKPNGCLYLYSVTVGDSIERFTIIDSTYK